MNEKIILQPELVSVLLPIYNPKFSYFKEALESIITQTYPALEIVIVSDGHSEEVEKYLKYLNENIDNKYQQRTIRIIRNEYRLGFQRSLNEGIKIANGRYIARQDSDDISLPKRIEKQVDFLQKNNKYALVGCNTFIVDDRGKVLGIRHYPQSYTQIKKSILTYCPFAHSGVMFKRDVIMEMGGYNENMSIAEDYALWLQVVKKYPCANIPQTLVKIRNRPESMKSKNLRKLVRITIGLKMNAISEEEYSVNFAFVLSLLLSIFLLFTPAAIAMKIFNRIISSNYFRKTNFMRVI